MTVAEPPCPDICGRQAAAQLLGPLRPDVCVCAHGVHRTLDDLFPPPGVIEPAHG